MQNFQSRKSTFSGIIILIATAFVWGFAFVAQREGVNHIDSISLSEMRYLIATIVLGVSVLLADLYKKRKGEKVVGFNRDTLIGGIFCGAILFVSTMVQQIGIESTTSGKAGFITVLYIVIVPILGVFARKRTSLVNCCAVLVAIMGFVLMCINESFTLAQGDALVFCSAITFGFHIFFVDLYCKNSDPIKFTFMQFATSAVIGFPFMAANGFPTSYALSESIIPLLYVGVLSSGLAYTLQVAGQKRVKASVATLIMSLESVIALFGGIIILGEESTAKELAGCLLVFIAVFIAQLELPHKFLQFRNNKYFVE